MMNKKNQHGGKRLGSGRKKGEETEVVRIPKAIRAQVEEMKKKHKEK